MTKTVLIVEDEVDTAEMLAEMMKISGYEVIKSYGGKQAISMISSKKPDVVVLDLMMPEFSGLDVLNFMRRDPRLDHIPVVIVSARNIDEDVQNCLDAGASCFLSKPVSFEEIKGAVETSIVNR
ncbi:MAG: response regulator [Anaerolineales bacterium]